MSSTKIVGIDIGVFSIKCARIEVHTRGFSISGYREYPLSQDLNADRALQTIEVLRDIVSHQDPVHTRYSVALPQVAASVRFKSFPFRDRTKIAKSLPFELEDEIPFDQDDATFDAKIIRFVGKQADVLACAVPKERIKDFIEFLRDGGIDPDIVTVEGFAYANTLGDFLAAPPTYNTHLADEVTQIDQSEPGDASELKVGKAYVHLGHEHSLITVMQRSSPIAIRSMLWGGRQVCDAIARKFQVPFHEALHVLQTKSFILMSDEGASRDQVAFSQTIKDSVKDCARELQLTLLEIQSELNIEIDQVFLTGALSQIPHLGPYLTQCIEKPVNLYNHLSRLSQTYLDDSTSLAVTSNVAVGLALEGLKRPRNPAINLRRDEFAKQSQVLQYLWDKWNTTAKIALAAVIAFFVYAPIRDTIAGSLADLSSQNLHDQAHMVAHLRGGAASREGVRRYVMERKRASLAQKHLSRLKNYDSALDVIKKFNDLVPLAYQVQIDIRKLSVNKDNFEVEGDVGDQKQLGILKKAIATMAEDGKVMSNTPSFSVAAPKVAFNFQMRINRWSRKASR